MKFVKMHGLGNDFIILDDTDHRQKNGREDFETEKHCCEESELSPELVRHFCDRHRGIGADGVIRVCNAEHPQADFRMKLYNADGSPAKMCGNGIRCLGKYVYDHGKTEKVNLLIETDAGLYRLQLIKKEDTDRICSVRVDMGTPEFVPEHISARFLLFRPVCVSMGNPHCVLFVESREAMLQFPLKQEGTVIGNEEIFPEGVNVEVVWVQDAGHRGQDKTYTYTGIISGQEETSTVDAVAEKAFARLSELQADDGSMLTYDERTSESTAWAMIALASWGRDPEQDGAFIKNGKTLIDGMQAFCLADGGIIHSLDSDEKETEGNNMAGYQTLYGLEAVRRLWEGQTRLFEMTDAQTVSADAIAAADKKLPALSDTDTTDTRSSEEVEADVSNRTLYLTAGIAVVIVVVVVIFLVLVLKESKKKKASAQNAQLDDDDDDEW